MHNFGVSLCVLLHILLAGHSWLRLCNHQQRLHPHPPGFTATREYYLQDISEFTECDPYYRKNPF